MAEQRVLIVEGDLALSAVLKGRLEDMGYLVDRVSDAGKALEILERAWVDLMVMSMILKGGMTGLELLREIRRRKSYSGIPVVVESKRAALRKTFEAMGVESFFFKPYPIDIFLEEVRDILTKKILILDDKRKLTSTMIAHIMQYGIHIDAVGDVNKFYANLTLKRYALAVAPYRSGNTMADRMVYAVRASGKNRSTPIIIYPPAGKSLMKAGEAREFSVRKEWCRQFGDCSFITRADSRKKFAELASMYLGFQIK
ncbi:MAG: response regulator [Candidatus Omnitrophota bacterium]